VAISVTRRTPHLVRAVLLAAALGLLAAVAGRTAADDIRKPVFTGACYCRAEGQVHCLGELTERACDRQCREALCDDWFWLERRACWNWGYGG
jgi:hypothetical protein